MIVAAGAVALHPLLTAPLARAQRAPMTLERLLTAFSRMPGLHARFTEEKRMAMLAVPLRTEGEIFFAPPDHLVRRVTAPTPSTALLEGDRLTLAQGARREVIDLSANAVVEGFVDTFRHVLAGDRGALERTYRIAFEEREGAWKLTLAPKTEALRRFLREMVLEGEGPALRTMRMAERNGDTTVTTFTDVNARRRFSSAERARIFRI
jgi:hypothetical protein